MTTRIPNLLTGIPSALPKELVERLLTTPTLRIERVVSLGHASSEGFWYDQDLSEWILLVSGTARLRFEGEEAIDLLPGSFVNIPAHKRHRVEWTDQNQPTVWLAIHYSPRS